MFESIVIFRGFGITFGDEDNLAGTAVAFFKVGVRLEAPVRRVNSCLGKMSG